MRSVDFCREWSNPPRKSGGGELFCKTRENSNFLKNGKIVISAENPEFF